MACRLTPMCSGERWTLEFSLPTERYYEEVGARGAECAESRVFCDSRRNTASDTNRHCRANTWSESAWVCHEMLPCHAACSAHTLFRDRSLCWGYVVDQICMWTLLERNTVLLWPAANTNVVFFFFRILTCVYQRGGEVSFLKEVVGARGHATTVSYLITTKKTPLSVCVYIDYLPGNRKTRSSISRTNPQHQP